MAVRESREPGAFARSRPYWLPHWFLLLGIAVLWSVAAVAAAAPG